MKKEAATKKRKKNRFIYWLIGVNKARYIIITVVSEELRSIGYIPR